MRALCFAALMMLVAAIALPDSVLFALAGTTPIKPSNLPKALFLALPHPGSTAPISAPGVQLTQWNGSFTDLTNKNVTYTMVGPNPATTNITTTVPVVIIPIKMVYGLANGNRTFDPLLVTLPNGQSLMANILASPLFQSNVTFVQGGTNVGTTQYIDAYQRANFWSSVGGTNTQYHVLLGTPTVLPEQTIVVGVQDGMVEANPFGAGNVGTMYVTDFDTAVQGFITKLSQINPGVLPLFVTYDTYLTQLPLGQLCCIGGYHSALGAQPTGQTYSYTTYVDSAGAFSENVSAMSHELGEWMDDPFVDNNVNCTDNSLMENGDPLENNANYGTFPYTVNGFTYKLQSLVFLGYFGAPRSTSLHNWLSFQNDEQSVCPGQ